MLEDFLKKQFSLEGQVAVVTGSTGVLGTHMAKGLALAGAKVGLLAIDRYNEVAAEIQKEGSEAIPLPASVLDKAQLEKARDIVLAKWGKVDILVNAAGGNKPAATLPPDGHIFDVPIQALRDVVELNLFGTILPTLVFGPVLTGFSTGKTGSKKGCIVNISSMNASRPLTRVVGYSAAKAAVENFTKWLSTDLAQKYGPGIRVNAIAPGFFIGEQNRSLLTNPDGSLTPRGQTIINHTPTGRFGEAEELVNTLVWLCSPGASFINGIVVPVDGGFSAFSGV